LEKGGQWLDFFKEFVALSPVCFPGLGGKEGCRNRTIFDWLTEMPLLLNMTNRLEARV
jgi:hypothetical protein